MLVGYARGRPSSKELRDMTGNDSTIRSFIIEFIERVNDRRADLLPLDLAILADIVSERRELQRDEARSSASQQVGGITYWLGLPSSLEEKFVGREADLDALAVDFHRVVVISGGAGTGKSRLAAEHSRRAGVDGFWTTAGVNALQTLAALAPSLGVPVGGGSDADTAREVQRSLSELAPKTLWVVDNVHDLDLVNELSSAVGSIHLLVTTRDARGHLLPPTVAFREIDVLDPDPAIALLCSRRRPESSWDSRDPSLGEIAKLVGRLPLALEMLAVRLGVPRQTPERILRQLKTAATPIELGAFQEAAGATISRVEGVYATIVGTLANLPPEVREQLSPLGYAADVPIPDPLLGVLTGLEREGLDRLIEECSGHSIFSLVDQQVVIHALTIAALAATNEKEIPATTLFRARERLPSINEADPRALRLEIVHYQNILEQTRVILGPEAADVLSFANNLAIGYYALGRYEEAVRLHEENLSIRGRELGPEHPDTLTSRNNLAGGYFALRRYEEAVGLWKETLSIRERVLGSDHPVTLGIFSNLASGYRALGRYQEATRLWEETLSIRGRELGLEHPDTLASRNNLALG